jgi:hypothetical protein
MACWRLQMNNSIQLATLWLATAPLIQLTVPLSAHGQSLEYPVASASRNSTLITYTNSIYSSSAESLASPNPNGDSWACSRNTEGPLPEAPEPGGLGANPERYNVPYTAEWHQPPFSRIGIGADVSPLGIGIKSAIVLNEYFDARLMANFFKFDPGRFEIEGFNVIAKVHMASGAASLDWYPYNSVWRLSPGLIFYNGNQLSASSGVAPGTSFTLDKKTFYSATPNPATGATPVTATGALGLHTNRPAATITGGFGKFIPRSNRHWSFPTEFGVAFTGAPSLNVNPSGWVCVDRLQLKCSNVADPADQIAIDFNGDLQATLTKLRRGLAKVPVYPLFSYSVVYSFNIK